MKFLKGFFKLLIASIIILTVFFPVTVFVHEATHYILYTMEGIPVTSFHVLDSESLQNGRFGFVTTMKESRYGSMFHEGVANIVGYLFIATTLLISLITRFKAFTVHQLESMGLKRNSYQRHVPRI